MHSNRGLIITIIFIGLAITSGLTYLGWQIENQMCGKPCKLEYQPLVRERAG